MICVKVWFWSVLVKHYRNSFSHQMTWDMALSTMPDYPKLFIPFNPLRLFKIRVHLNYTDENCWKRYK